MFRVQPQDLCLSTDACVNIQPCVLCYKLAPRLRSDNCNNANHKNNNDNV